MSSEAPSSRMKDKVALITGAARGIGAAAAELFCSEGAEVFLVDSDVAALTERADAIRERVIGARVDVAPADVGNPAQVEAAAAQAVRRFGRLTTLVSNAAIRYLAAVETADPREWERLYSVNVLGAVNVAKAALPTLRRGRGTSIVLVSSAYAVTGRKSFGAYDSTKAALLSLTRTLAAEEAEHGIRVNAVCPGGTLTPFTIGRAAARGLSEEKLRQEQKPDNLLRRWAEAKEIAYPILWLASDEASYVTGATLMVDAGATAM